MIGFAALLERAGCLKPLLSQACETGRLSRTTPMRDTARCLPCKLKMLSQRQRISMYTYLPTCAYRYIYIASTTLLHVTALSFTFPGLSFSSGFQHCDSYCFFFFLLLCLSVCEAGREPPNGNSWVDSNKHRLLRLHAAFR